jgi:hypothetical protein
MQPRRSDSKKWTSLPGEYLENLQTTLKSTYEKELADTEVITEGRVFDKEILLRIGLLPKGRLKQNNFEISFDLPEAKDQVLNKLNNAIDFLGSLINEFIDKDGFDNFEHEESLPVIWKPLADRKDIFHFQYSTVNSKLESLADEWLNKQADALVHEKADEGDDAYNFAEQYDAETLEKIIELKKLQGEDTHEPTDSTLH